MQRVVTEGLCTEILNLALLLVTKLEAEGASTPEVLLLVFHSWTNDNIVGANFSDKH